MSFWVSDSKVPVEQTYSAHSATNGLVYKPGQVIHIDIPPSTQYIKPNDSHLQMDVKLTAVAAGGHKTRLQLDAQIGAQSLIRDLRIYSSTETGGVLLEEIQDYNALVGIKYDYNTDDSLKAKRAVSGEGSTTHKPETRGTLGTTRSMCADIMTNPYFKSPEKDKDQDTAFSMQNDFLTAKCCIPLHSGIFSSQKVWPNLYTGLRVEIVLEDASKCVRQLESVLRHNKLNLNPVFSSASGASVAEGQGKLANTDTLDRIYIKMDNSQSAPWKCPFVVGEFINLTDGTNSGSFTNSSAEVKFPHIVSINASANASGADGLVELVFSDTFTYNTTGAAEDALPGWYVYSESVEQTSKHDTDSGHLFQPDYTISNVEMIVQNVSVSDKESRMMDSQMREGGVMAIDVLSFTNYKYSALRDDIVANIRIPLNNSRARSILCLPTDSTKYTGKQALTASTTYDVEAANNGNGTSNSTRSGLVGIVDELTNYQFLYDGKLQPSRQVPCSKTSSRVSIDAQPIIELEKALVQAGIPVRSVSAFRSNFVVGRALSLNMGVYDTRGKDFNLQVNYQGDRPSKNKLWFNYVAHLRRISIKGDSIKVMV